MTWCHHSERQGSLYVTLPSPFTSGLKRREELCNSKFLTWLLLEDPGVESANSAPCYSSCGYRTEGQSRVLAAAPDSGCSFLNLLEPLPCRWSGRGGRRLLKPVSWCPQDRPT